MCLYTLFVLVHSLTIKMTFYALGMHDIQSFSCPWTGTAIGKKNMTAFQCFVGLVFVCLILDIVLLTGALS